MSPKTLKERYPQFEIGQHSYGGLQVRGYGEDVQLAVGDYCSFAKDVEVLLGGEHQSRFVSTYPFNVMFEGARLCVGHPRLKGDVLIGNDVWIGRGAMILSGVTIGDGAIIGARALVARDVSPYSVVAGVPARTVRKRFDDDVIRELLAIRWWEWPEDQVVKAAPFLMNEDVRSFIEAAKRGDFGSENGR